MVDAAKYITELKSLLGIQRTRRSMFFACGFMFAFVAFTIFLIFNPNDNSSSPWFNRIFATSDSHTYKSNFSSVYSFFFSDDPTTIPPPPSIFSQNSNCNTIPIPSNSSSLSSSNSTLSSNNSTEISKPSNAPKDIRSSEIGVSNATLGETEKKANMVSLKDGDTEKKAKMISLKNCDIFDGKWVRDESYPLYPEGSCLIDEQYNCFLNGRPDRDYQKLRWQPNDCNIPRLNGTDMLERLRGKRLVFVGDSLNRNMWESLVCILRNSVKDKSRVFEASGRKEFKSKGIYVFIFKDYNCSVEFFWAPFLVQEWQVTEPNGTTKETLRLDLIEKMSPEFKKADVIIFNTGHWWTHEKTSKGKDYYQEGSHVYSDLNVLEAFRKAITTWARWVEANVNPNKTLVFFRGYSASHFSGGKWNSGGQCDNETEPIKNSKYLDPYLDKMIVLESVLKWMKIPVNYMNITLMTDYRKDGHPSIYRKQNMTEEDLHTQLMHQDCSHWCLPGVPDSWNELLYARLISYQIQNQIKNKT